MDKLEGAPIGSRPVAKSACFAEPEPLVLQAPWLQRVLRWFPDNGLASVTCYALSREPDMGANERMRGYRDRRRAAGLRLLQLWVPDTRSRRFANECRRQSRLMQGDPAESETLEFIERAASWEDRAPR